MTDNTLIKDFERLEQDVTDLEAKLQQAETTLQRNEERIEALVRESGKKDEQNRIEELEAEVKQRDTKITELEGGLAAKGDEIACAPGLRHASGTPRPWPCPLLAASGGPGARLVPQRAQGTAAPALRRPGDGRRGAPSSADHCRLLRGSARA